MLKFEHVTKVYGGKKALNDLTLSFCPVMFTLWSDRTAAEKAR